MRAIQYHFYENQRQKFKFYDRHQKNQQKQQQDLLQLESVFFVTSFMGARLRQGVRRLRLLTDWLSSGHCQSEAAISSL